MGIVRATHTRTALAALLSQFAVPPLDYTTRPINNGLINDTFLVLDGEDPLYILQHINHSVFGNVTGVMNNVSKALSLLKGPGYTPIELISTITGKTSLVNTDGVWRLMSFIPNSITYNTTTQTSIAFEAGRIIGEFHLLLKDANTNEFTETIPNFQNLEFRKDQFEEALDNADPARLKKALQACTFAGRVLKKLVALPIKMLPERICHNDTKLNNILFSSQTNKALCLIDLDTVMKGYFFYDFGDAVRTIVNTAEEDEKNLDLINFDMDLFNAFIRGLATTNSFLTPEDIQSLPLGTAYMPFIHGLRALTDYLSGDVYYKVAYPDQNFDRALSLFDFTQKALDRQKDIEKVLADNFKDIL